MNDTALSTSIPDIYPDIFPYGRIAPEYASSDRNRPDNKSPDNKSPDDTKFRDDRAIPLSWLSPEPCLAGLATLGTVNKR